MVALATDQPTRIVRAPKGEHPYFMMVRQTAQDRTLSWAARGMLAYLLSKPNHWEVQPTDLEQGCGKDKVYSTLKELHEARYLSKKQLFDEQHRTAGWEYQVHEIPYPEKPEMEIEPQPIIPFPEIPFTENPPLDIKESIEKKESKTLSEPASQASEAAPQKPQNEPEPIPPQGYRWLCSSSSDSLMHLIPAVSNDKSARPLCKGKVPNRVAYNVLNLKPPCAECLRIAADPPKKPEKAKALSSQPVFEALADVVFGISDPADIGELGGRIGPIRERLIKHVLKKRDVPDLDEPTIAELVGHIKRFGKWYDEKCKGCERPASPDKFMTHWLRYTKKAASQNGKPKFDPITATWSKPS